jgi:propionyl-CoA synthetase
MGTYRETYDRSIADPEGFWAEAAKAITWHREPTRVLDAERAPLYRWFPDGQLNTCQNALDRHVDAGHGDRLALVHDSAVTTTARRFTYAELREEPAQHAGGLRRRRRWASMTSTG